MTSHPGHATAEPPLKERKTDGPDNGEGPSSKAASFGDGVLGILSALLLLGSGGDEDGREEGDTHQAENDRRTLR